MNVKVKKSQSNNKADKYKNLPSGHISGTLYPKQESILRDQSLILKGTSSCYVNSVIFLKKQNIILDM